MDLFSIVTSASASKKQIPKVITACGTSTASLQHTFTGQKVEFSLTSPVPLASGVTVELFNQAITGSPTDTPANFLIQT